MYESFEKVYEIENQIIGNQIIRLKENITEIKKTTGLIKAEKKYKEAELNLTNLKWKLCTGVTNFQECADAGYEVLMPDCKYCPGRCITPEDVIFTEQERTCVDKCGDGIRQ